MKPPPGVIVVPGEYPWGSAIKPIVVAHRPDGTRKIYYAEFLYVVMAA